MVLQATAYQVKRCPGVRDWAALGVKVVPLTLRLLMTTAPVLLSTTTTE